MSDLDRILAAIAQVESAGNPYALRFEPGYRWLYDVANRRSFRRLFADELLSVIPPNDFPSIPPCSKATEWIAQRTSWGMYQIMGALLRELGYRRPYLAEICGDAAEQREYAVRHLTALLRRYNGDMWAAVEAWNAGTAGTPAGRRYAAKVREAYESLRGGSNA